MSFVGESNQNIQYIWQRNNIPFFYRTVGFGSIKSVATGHTSNTFRQCKNSSDKFTQLYPPERCFSLELKDAKRSLDLVAPSEQQRGAWVSAIGFLLADYQRRDRKERLDRWLARHFREADKSRDGVLSFEECLKLLKSLSSPMRQAKAREVFEVGRLFAGFGRRGANVFR